MAYLEITSFPIQRRDSGADSISPVADLALRLTEKTETIELRIQKLRETVHCFVGIETTLRAKQLIHILQLKNYGVVNQPNVPPMFSEDIMLRHIHENYNYQVNGHNNTAIIKEICGSDVHPDSLFFSLNTMEEGAGYSVFIRRKDGFTDPNTTIFLKDQMADNNIEYKLFHSTELFQCCICVYGKSKDQIAMLQSELQYAFPNLQSYHINRTKIVSKDVWGELNKLQNPIYIFGIEETLSTYLFAEIQQFTSLKNFYKVERVAVNKDSLFPKQKSFRNVGERYLTLGYAMDGSEQRISLKELRRHMFIAGAPGTGKGNIIFSLAEQLHKLKVPMLLIESAKQEQHHLKKKIPDLRVWRPTAGEYILNPFSIPPGVTMGEYRASLLQMLRVCFKAEGGPLEELYASTLSRCLAKYGYTENSEFNSLGVTPFGLSEFIEEYNQLLINNGYSDRTYHDMRTAGITRLRALFDQNPAVFDTVNSIPVSELAHGENLLQLNNLTTMEAKQLFATILLISLGAWLRLKGNPSDELQLVIIMDESHNLLKGVEKQDGNRFSFAEDFQNLLLEMRSVGVGFIVADQSANNLPHLISEVCATKVFMGASRFSGIEEYVDVIGADEITLSHLYLLNPGEGIWNTYGMSSGAFFSSKNVIEDYHVNEKYGYSNSYLSSNRAYICHTFAECKCCKSRNTCSVTSKENARLMAMRLMNQYKGKLITGIRNYESAHNAYNQLVMQIVNGTKADIRQLIMDNYRIKVSDMKQVHDNLTNMIQVLKKQEDRTIVNEYLLHKNLIVGVLHTIAQEIYHSKDNTFDTNCCIIQFVRIFNRESEISISKSYIDLITDQVEKLMCQK